MQPAGCRPQAPELLADPNLVVRLQGELYPWQVGCAASRVIRFYRFPFLLLFLHSVRKKSEEEE